MYKERDVRSMVLKLLELHSSMDEVSTIDRLRQKYDGFSEKAGRIGLSTLRDISFRHSYGRDLSEARQWISAFCNTKKLLFIHQAWDIYYKIHTKYYVKGIPGEPLDCRVSTRTEHYMHSNTA